MTKIDIIKTHAKQAGLPLIDLKMTKDNIFASILDMRSMTAIGYMADDALAGIEGDSDRKALSRIAQTNSLDEAWAICHEQLGNAEEAAKLRQWIADKASRKLSQAS